MKTENSYRIEGEISPIIFTKIYALCAKWCEFIQLIQRASLSEIGIKQLDALLPFRVLTTTVNEWPGTQLLGGKAAVAHRFSITNKSINVLSSVLPSPLGYDQAGLLEDLYFFRRDDSPLLASISHENDCFFLLTEEEAEELGDLLGPAFVAE